MATTIARQELCFTLAVADHSEPSAIAISTLKQYR